MSQTIAHRHATQIHVPLAPIMALIVAIIVAAAVLILINQPVTTTPVKYFKTSVATSPAAQAAKWRAVHNFGQSATQATSNVAAVSTPSSSRVISVPSRLGPGPSKAQ
jgi:hypothetical protein